MPYLLGLRGEIQPAYYIFPEGIPPTMSQPSFSVFNFSFKKKKEVVGTEMNGAQCVPVRIHRATGKWALQLKHICDFSTGLNESWIKMGQSNILWQIFPLRKWQVLKCTHCSSKSGKLIKAVLRRAAGLVKPVKCKLRLLVTLPALLCF